MRKIPLSQGKFALVDDGDFEWLNQWKWCAQRIHNTFYAERGVHIDGKHKIIFMHRAILSTPKGMLTDHKDGDGLNNQRSNLRICTDLQNKRNSKKHKSSKHPYKGIRWLEKGRCWSARIIVDRREVYLGRFKSATEAALAYDKAAKEYFGEFARLNFPNLS